MLKKYRYFLVSWIFLALIYLFIIRNIENINFTEEEKHHSIFDTYEFSYQSGSEYLWRQGSHGDLLNLADQNLKEFMKYKEAQYELRRNHIFQACKKIRNEANLKSQKSISCLQNSKNIYILEPREFVFSKK